MGSYRKKIVVFGGAGFLGRGLISRLISMDNPEIIAVSRNEGELVKLKEIFPSVEIMVGDIADRWMVKKAMNRANEVYLLSALKHVGIAERDVMSCLKTNIMGVMNVVGESLITKPKLLMFISTDKAAQSIGVYGSTKKLGECLVHEAERINEDTNYRIVRYGNVWNSTGSIVTKWRPKMEKGEEVILTSPTASRFFWSLEEAVDLIFTCINNATDSTPYIPEMKAASMGVVLEACMQKYGRVPVKVIGLQPGENMTETMDGKIFSDQVEQFTVEEFIQTFLK